MIQLPNGSDAAQRQFSVMAGIQRALALCNSGDMGGGLTACREVLALEPDNRDALLVGAGACVSLGDSEAAAELFEALLSRHPSNAKAQFHYGGVLRSLDRSEDALAAFRATLAIEPEMADAHNNIGGILQTMGDDSGAIKSYETAAGLRSGDAGAHYFLGNRFLELGATGRAVEAFQKALALASDFAPAHAGLANAMLYGGDPAAALDACDKCLSIDPMNRNAISYKSIALTETGEDDSQRILTDFGLLIRAVQVSPPAGYRDLADFNRAIADYISGHPKLGQDRAFEPARRPGTEPSADQPGRPHQGIDGDHSGAGRGLPCGHSQRHQSSVSGPPAQGLAARWLGYDPGAARPPAGP